MPLSFPPSTAYLNECLASATFKKPLKRDIHARLQNVIDSLAPRYWKKTIAKADSDRDDFLCQKKIEFDLLQAWCDLKGWLTFEQLGHLRSQFAEASIHFALASVVSNQDYLHYFNDDAPDKPRVLPGLFILGLGKLGGNDLNFSSDVDLIAYYDEAQVPIAAEHGIGYVCSRILQDVSNLLSDVTDSGFVWRVDWRLRPEASINPLAISTDMAEEFYRYRSLPWHRLALCKARVIAGDYGVGKVFLADINNYIWQRNLDYRSFDDLQHLKQRINDEHPGLEVQREQQHKVTRKAAGFNLKLGRGGIREIEFIVNALQLVWGGRKKSLQISNTLMALQRLSNLDLINPEVAENLTVAYMYFRTLENRLQMLDNQQLHTLPEDKATQTELLSLLEQDWKQLGQALYRHRTLVAREFDQMFALEKESSQNAELPAWVSDLDEYCTQVVSNWHQGFQVYGAPNTLTTSLAELFHQLLALIDEHTDKPGVAIRTIDEFFESLPPGGQYFRLLQAFPHLLELTVPALIRSPLMTHLLEQSPHIVDALIEEPTGLRGKALQAGLENIIAETSPEIQMNGFRRFINEQLYAIYGGFLHQQLSYTQLTERLTVLAEQALESGVTMVCRQMKLDQPPLTVLGLGKLGMWCMAPASDLDLIYIASEEVSIDLANEFSNRMQTLMSAQMREGVVYEMDMRLRPSGASGPPTVTLKSFRDYHRQYARTWEHLALIPARVVAGDKVTGKKVMQHRKVILRRPRDAEQLLNDVTKMHGMLVEQRVVEGDQLSIKLRSGGLLQAEYLANAILLERVATEQLALSDYPSMLEQGLIDAGYEGLLKAIHFWRPLQVWERILGLQECQLDEIPEHYHAGLFAAVGKRSYKTFIAAVNQHSNYVTKLAKMFFAQATALESIEDWPDETVKWRKNKKT